MSVGLLRDLWDRVLGTTQTGASASSTGSLAQQVAYLVQQLASHIANPPPSEMRVKGQGYYTLPIGPSGGLTVTPVSGAYGSWTELVASLGGDIYVVGATIRAPSAVNLSYVQWQIGVGPSGSEQVVTTSSVANLESSNDTKNGELITFKWPLRISSGSRIALRAAASSASNVAITLHVVNVADVVGL